MKKINEPARSVDVILEPMSWSSAVARVAWQRLWPRPAPVRAPL